MNRFVRSSLAVVLCAALPPAALSAPTNYAPPWKSYQETGNPADIINSPTVAAAIGSKVDATNGQAQSLQLMVNPSDKPGSVSTAVPNTWWVDNWYTPKQWFILTNTTWTVCASGCNYTSPLDAWNAALNVNFLNSAILTISIADGTYNVTSQMITQTPETNHVQVIGNQTTPANVVLNFTNVQGNNFSGFAAVEGGMIGLLDGFTMHSVGQLASQTASVSTWNNNSWGAGIYARGGTIQVGSHVIIDTFYYSAVADNGGYILASNGMTGINAGDVNFMARHNGVLLCIGCTAIRAADNANPAAANLGCNYTAESGGTLIITNSTGSGANIGSVCGLTNGHGWAHGFKGTGGLNGKNGDGAWLQSGSSIELENAEFYGYNDGIYVGYGSYADVNGAYTHDNATDGMVADGGSIQGNNAKMTNNGNYGIEAFHQGKGEFFYTFANITGNTAGVGNVEAAGTINGLPYQGSSLVIN